MLQDPLALTRPRTNYRGAKYDSNEAARMVSFLWKGPRIGHREGSSLQEMGMEDAEKYLVPLPASLLRRAEAESCDRRALHVTLRYHADEPTQLILGNKSR